MRTRNEVKELAIRRKAMEMIVEKGFDGLSMHKLAKAADISVATIYIYHKDREDLILSLCREEMDRFAKATLEGFDPEMSFEEGLRIQWRNRAEFWLENPIESQFLERMRHSPYQERYMHYLQTDFVEAMMAFVKNAIKRNELVPLPVEVYWSVAFAPLYQLVKFHMDQTGFPGNKPVLFTETLMEEVLQLVLKALRP
jgi:TetR/AcrR family transcriptional regulator, multidrug resistance operon repressor